MLEHQDHLLYHLLVGIGEFYTCLLQTVKHECKRQLLMVIQAMLVIRGCAIILGTFSGVLPDFWVPSWAIPGFLGVIFLVKFYFFRNNPDLWVLILIFY